MSRTIVLLLTLLCFNFSNAQEISPFLIGTNSWQPPWHSGAQINNLWDKLNSAGIQMIRIGGNEAQNANSYTKERVADLIDSIRSIGAEPIVQVPHTFSAQQSTEYIAYLNGTKGLNIKYWGIGNEPNLDNDWSKPIPVSEVAEYIKTISSALKAYDPSIKVQGPDCAWYDSNYNNPLFVNAGANNVAGKDANGNYYIDIYAWHKYDVKGASDIESTVNSAIGMINKINENRPESPMTWAIGEINSHWDNSMVGEEQKVWSFRSGQVFAELYDLAMRKGGFTICPWSVFEGNGSRNNGDLGMFDLVNGELKPRSNYCHTLMLGQNMHKFYLINADNNANISVCAMGDSSGVAIMIMNKSTTKDFEYSLSLNGEYQLGKELTIRVEAGIDKVMEGEIEASSTKMLVFNAEGLLSKRYTYTKRHADNMVEPILENFSGTSGEMGSLEFITPENGAHYDEKDTVFVTMNATSADGIQGVSLYLNDVLVRTDSLQPFEWASSPADSLLRALPLGNYQLKAVAITEKGDSICTSIQFSVQKPIVLPQVVFTNPQDGAKFKTGVNLDVTNLSATHPNGIANVKLFINGVLVRQENLSPYDWGLDGQNDTKLENLKAGTYELKAIATATSGEKNEAIIHVYVENEVGETIINGTHLKVFPNPVSTNLFVRNLLPHSSLELLNLSGRVICRELNYFASELMLDMENYNDGMYFLRIMDQEQSSVLKILKQVK